MKNIYLTITALLTIFFTNQASTQTVTAYNSQNILPGQTVKLFANADTIASQTVVFQWTPTIGMTNPTSISPTVSPTQTTTYHVNVTVNGSFYATDSVTITVVKPTVNAGVDKSIQYGGSVSFYDASFDPILPMLFPESNSAWTQVKFFSENLGYITKLYTNKVYKTFNNGTSFIEILKTNSNISSMTFSDSLKGAVGTIDGNYYYTTNGGQSWSISFPSTVQINGIFFTPNFTYIVCNGGIMKKSSNGGQSWTTVSMGTVSDLLSVQFLNDSIGFVGVYLNTGCYIIKTLNYGNTWTTQGGAFPYIYDMHFINENIGYVAAYGEAKRTVNGGQTWSNIVVDGGLITGFPTLLSIDFINDSVGYMGSPFIKTTDGGANWTSIITQNPPTYGLSAVDEHIIFGMGLNNYVRYLDPQFTWSPANYLDNPTILKPTFTPGVTTNYILNVATIAGYSTIDTVNISVPDPCLSQINYVVNASTSSVVFSTLLSQPPYTVSPFAFLWQFGDGMQSTQASVNHVFPSQGYQNIHFTASSWNGCNIDTTFVVSIGNAAAIDCQADFGYSVNHTTRAVSLSNFSMGDNLNQYTWYFDDGTYDNNPVTTHTYATAGNYNVCLTVGSQTTGCYNTKCKQIVVDTVGQNCTAQFNNTIDTNTRTATFINTSRNNITSSWDFGDNNFSTDENPLHIYQNNRYYMAELVINGNGCIDYLSKIINVNMATPSLYSGFGYLVDGTYYKVNKYPVKFYSASAGTPAKYYWDFGDGTADSLTNQPLHEYDNPGNYTVCLTVSDPTAQLTFDTCITIIISGFNKFEEEANFQVFPNPANNYLNIEMQTLTVNDFSMAIMDIRGVNLFTKDKIQNTEKVDISSLPNGIYFVKIYNSNESNIRKLMINR